MKEVKKYLWKSILNDIENSQDEKFKDKFKVFKTHNELKQYLNFFFKYSFDDMKRIRSVNYYLQKQKYHIRDKRLLGTKTKAMPDEIYLKLIEYVGRIWGNKAKLCLEFEGIEGPRGEDSVRVKLQDFNFEKHSVLIKNRKSGGRIYEVPLNAEIEKELQEHIENNLVKIKENDNYIFFSDNPVQKRKHISQRTLKNLVHKALEDLNLNVIYGYSSTGKPLYLYSLHSLRGHAASRVFVLSNGDYKKAQEILDHQDLETTMLYLEKNNMKDLKNII